MKKVKASKTIEEWDAKTFSDQVYELKYLRIYHFYSCNCVHQNHPM